MTTSPPPGSPSPAPRGRGGPSGRANLWRSQTRRDQLFFGVMAVVLLVVAALLQGKLTRSRVDWNLVKKETPDSEKSYRSLAINFPRLTMGGFRGILSTYLWQQAEDDKNEHRWLDLETKYDIIGALQPYFVSVYIFHSWNQAYNLSAQWQEEDSKYKWVLDGEAYLYKGEEYNPGNSDLYLEEANLYFLKLGGAFERLFYRRHWRADLARLHELNDSTTAQNDAAVALGHVRDFVHHRDPRYPGDAGDYLHISEMRDPAQRAGGTGWGIEIAFPTDPKTGFNLFSARTDGKKPDEPMPFRYGVSPFYFAYREYTRCMAAGGPQNGSVQVFDAWPGMSLRMWCRDDLYYSFQTMNELFGPTPDADLLNNKERFNAKVAEIHDCYRNVQMVGPRAIQLLNEHLGRYPMNVGIHTKHILETTAFMALGKAENKLFDALVQWQINDRKMNDSIKAQFQEANAAYDDAYTKTLAWVDNMYPVVLGQPADPNRADSERYAIAVKTRQAGIANLLNLPPNEKPDMSFFQDEVVEK
jgi:hypothetical protein